MRMYVQSQTRLQHAAATHLCICLHGNSGDKKTLQHPATPCSTLQHTIATHPRICQHGRSGDKKNTPTHCNTPLQQTCAFADVAVAATRKIGRSSSKELDKSSAVDAPVSQLRCITLHPKEKK